MDVDLAQVRQAFVAETEEDLALVEQVLLKLEKAPDDAECVATVFRKFHTLKGNANALGLGQLGEFAHKVEDLFEGLRSGSQPVTPALVTYLLQVVDLVRTMLADAAAGRDVAVPAGAALLQRVEGGRFQESPQRAEGAAAPDESELVGDAASTLRIDVGKLDDLLSITSEIAIARGRLELLIEQQGTPATVAAYHSLERLLNTLHHSVSKVRMVPIGPLLRRHERVVRDLALTHHKQAELVVSDHGVEVDNSVIERLRAPLVHMVRNAVHHGLEPPELRLRAGKPARGKITLRARHEASDIVIEVEDDGAGLDRSRIVERARAFGLVADGASLSERQIDRLIFSQGVSTAAEVTGTSGRGVGLDVVHRNVDGLGGSVEVESRPGQGTTFTVRMPLTLAIIEGLLGRVGEQMLVIPMAGVVRCLDLAGSSGTESADGVINVEGRAVPFARLRALFGADGRSPQREVAVVIQRGNEQIGLAVDQLVGRAQIVVKPPGRFFKGLPAVSGLTILGDGRVAPILNVSGLLHEHLRHRAAADEAAPGESGAAAGRP